MSSNHNYYEDEGYRPNDEPSDDYENYPDYDQDLKQAFHLLFSFEITIIYDFSDLDSDAINDFSSQELDQRIQQMKAKIKDLQEDDEDYKEQQEIKHKQVYDYNSEEHSDQDDEKELLKDKIENIKKAIQQYNSDNEDLNPPETNIQRYYKEDDQDDQEYLRYQQRKGKPAKKSPVRKQWKDSDLEDDEPEGEFYAVKY